MNIIIFRKSDYMIVGKVLPPMTLEQELSLNVIPNFGESDYLTLRVSDEEYQKMSTNEYFIENDELVIGNEKPLEPQPPSQTDILAEELVRMKFENMQKDTVISTFGEEITKLKLEMMILKGGM